MWGRPPLPCYCGIVGPSIAVEPRGGVAPVPVVALVHVGREPHHHVGERDALPSGGEGFLSGSLSDLVWID